LGIAYISEGFLNIVGLFYIFNSSGARSTLSDYSGRYDLDAIINGHQVGLVFEHLMKMKDRKGYGIYTDVAYLRTKLKTRDYLSLVYPAKYTNTENHLFLANGFTLEPGVYASYSTKVFYLRMNLGILLSFSEGLFLEDEKDMKLYVHEDKVKPGWTGFRVGFQVETIKVQVKKRK
jgi:hypothetical protein